MSLDSYHREKFSNAMYSLATHLPLNQRLIHAFTELVMVQPENFSNQELGEKYRTLYAQVTAAKEQYEGQGTLQATLFNMNEDELNEVARIVVEINNQLLWEAVPV